MPIDVLNEKYYNFNFDKLIDIPKQHYNSKPFLKYLNDWKWLLKNNDKKAIDEYNYFANKCNSRMLSPEFFQFYQEYMNDSAPYIFHFNIDQILRNIVKEKYKSKLITVKKLAASVSYDKSIILDDRKVKRIPIILCELPMPKFKYFVADGNTRLNYFLKINKWLTKYIIYDVTHKYDFLLSVDWVMYNFVNELNIILQDYTDNNKMEQNIRNSKIYNSHFIEETEKDYL